MTLQHADTVIAFVALMLAASLVVTAGTQLVISLLGLRGSNLRRALQDVFETASLDRDARRHSKEIARRVLRHPLISSSAFSRFCVRMDDLPFLPADAAGKLRWAGNGIPFQPWLLGALGGCLLWPLVLRVMDRLFTVDFSGYSAIVARYVPLIEFCGHPWRSGAIAGALVGGILSRWRLATSIHSDELIAVLEKLSAPANGTLPDPAQRAMLVMAGEAANRPRPKTAPVSARLEKMFQDAIDEDEGGVAVAVEKAVAVDKAVAQVSAEHTEPQPEGLKVWFERSMERASQRFTLQARVITVALSIVLVFAAHLDAIRLFQSLSSDAQLRAQLAGSADALSRQAASSQAKEGGRPVVPDIYHSAMVALLMSTPASTAEQTKTKTRRSAKSSAAPQPLSNASLVSTAVTVPGDAPVLTDVSAPVSEEGQAAPVASPATPEAPAKTREKKAAHPKAKSAAKDSEKSAAAVPPVEDKVLTAKARAAKALEFTPGFASREDAVSWLRTTLDGDPAVANLTAAYEQDVNAGLSSEADKLVDHTASMKRQLARSEFQLFPETWPGFKPAEHELPGLLVALAFLCLGAPLCYNALKVLASLRPASTKRQYKQA